MSSKKISELTDRVTITGTEQIPLAFNGVNYSITPNELVTYIGNNIPNLPLTTSVTITSAQVLQLNSTPVQIVATPGVGKAIEVINSFAQIKTYGGTPYGTNTTLALISDTATSSSNQQVVISGILARTAATIKLGQGPGIGGFDNNPQIIENKALMAYVYAGNPTGGNSDIIINILYRIVNV